MKCMFPQPEFSPAMAEYSTAVAIMPRYHTVLQYVAFKFLFQEMFLSDYSATIV